MLRLVIVDDHPVARHGLRAILEKVEDVVVVAVAVDAAGLPRDCLGVLQLDVVVLDLYLADGRPALTTITELSAQVPVLVVSASGDVRDVLAAMQAGAAGYLTKQADEEEYATAIRTIRDRRFHLSAHLADVLRSASHGPDLFPKKRLSAREREALLYIARGFTARQTATRMGVSTSTVDTYIIRIRAKLGLGNKAELALAAIRNIDGLAFP